MRLILPFNQHILNNLHIFIAKSLEPIILRLPRIVTHSLEIIHNLTQKTWDNTLYLFKADVIAMYPNVHLNNALHIAARFLSGQPTQECNQLKYTEWLKILTFAFYKIEFSWKDDIWFCGNGVPIGSPCGPHIAIIGLQLALQKNITIINKYCKYYGAYIDDHFDIATTPAEQWIHKLIPTTDQPYLEFEPSESISLQKLCDTKSTFNILDIKFWAVKLITNQVQLISDVYTKPVGAYQYLHWTSAHPQTVKLAIPRGEIIRRSRIINKSMSITNTRMDLIRKLIRRGYPAVILINTLSRKYNTLDNNTRLLLKIQNKKKLSCFPWNSNGSGIDKVYNTSNETCKQLVWPIISKYHLVLHKSIKHIKNTIHSSVFKFILSNNLFSDWHSLRTILTYKKHRTLLAFLTKKVGNF